MVEGGEIGRVRSDGEWRRNVGTSCISGNQENGSKEGRVYLEYLSESHSESGEKSTSRGRD